MTGSCLCGAVRIEITEKPEYIYDCNCSLCWRSGAAWGYFKNADVSASGATVFFSRDDKAEAKTEVHSCPHCSTTTHWSFTSGYKAENPSVDSIGINMKLFDPRELDGVEVRFPNGREWPGEGPYNYRRAPLTIGDQLHW